MNGKQPLIKGSLDWKFVLTLVFILANTYLVSQGKQQLSADILRTQQSVAYSCMEAFK